MNAFIPLSPAARRNGAVAIATLVCLSSHFAQELIVNGSFESTSTFSPDRYNMMSLPQGSTVIPGWTVADAELLWASNANPFGPKTPYGFLFLDLTGYHDRTPYGAITQTITTTS